MQTKIRYQATKYLLINWHRYDLLADKLDYINMQNMKNLYKGLSQLTEEERTFLADKYHHQDGKRLDREVSKLYGIQENEYRKQRVSIEKKLHALVQDDMQALHDETGFAPYAVKPIRSRDGNREDVPTGLRYLVRKQLEEEGNGESYV